VGTNRNFHDVYDKYETLKLMLVVCLIAFVMISPFIFLSFEIKERHAEFLEEVQKGKIVCNDKIENAFELLKENNYTRVSIESIGQCLELTYKPKLEQQ
jgi:hypothetical protein